MQLRNQRAIFTLCWSASVPSRRLKSPYFQSTSLALNFDDAPTEKSLLDLKDDLTRRLSLVLSEKSRDS